MVAPRLIIDQPHRCRDIVLHAVRDQVVRQADPPEIGRVRMRMRFLVTQDIVEPYVKGWIPNVRDFNRSRWLWIDRRAKPERGD